MINISLPKAQVQAVKLNHGMLRTKDMTQKMKVIHQQSRPLWTAQPSGFESVIQASAVTEEGRQWSHSVSVQGQHGWVIYRKGMTWRQLQLLHPLFVTLGTSPHLPHNHLSDWIPQRSILRNTQNLHLRYYQSRQEKVRMSSGCPADPWIHRRNL